MLFRSDNVLVVAEDLVAEQVRNLHIAHKVDHNVLALVENQADNQAVDLDQADLVLVLAQVVHLVKMLERKRITRVRKLVVKRSTICKPQLWVALLFLAVMEILQSDYVEVHLLQTLPRKSEQILQRLSQYFSISERWSQQHNQLMKIPCTF